MRSRVVSDARSHFFRSEACFDDSHRVLRRLALLRSRSRTRNSPRRSSTASIRTAQRGTTVECEIAGAELKAATALTFGHPGITAELVAPRNSRIAVKDDVPVGRYDVRAVCPLGVSSCRSFVVGDRKQVLEVEPNNDPEKSQRVELPVTVAGRIKDNLDVDRFTFAANKGDRVFVDAWAWRLDSKLDATLLVTGPDGRELAYNGDYYGKDAFVDFVAPADGDYSVKIWDFVYGAGSEMTYRLEIGTFPHLDAIVPNFVAPGKPTTVTIYGRNLPGGRPATETCAVAGRPLEMLTQEVTLSPSANGIRSGEAIRPAQALLEGTEFRLTTGQGSSNPLFVEFVDAPAVLEQEPNGALDAAQRVTVPSEVAGSFGAAGDLDFYSFEAKKGETLVIEIFGERNSGLTDPMMAAFDAKGKRIALGSADDFGRNIGKLRFPTNTRDSRWDFNVPADGVYTVQVRDLYHQQRGDARFTYRLSFRRPQPDFRLIAAPTADILPDATVVRRGGNYWLDVLVSRNDGFDGPITVRAENLPAGVTAEPVVVGKGRGSVPLVFHAAPDAPPADAVIRIVGTATIGESTVERVARGGGLTWSTVNTPGIARMNDTIPLAVREAPPFTITAKPKAAAVEAGKTLTIDVDVARAADWNDDVQLSGYDLPDKATVPLVTVKKGSTTGTVELTLPPNQAPGPYTITIHGSGQAPKNYPTEPDVSKRDKNIRCLTTSNPITFEVTAAEKK
ncbi:MAG: PPC domain-containing protein [Pirellulales bacterium]